MNARDSGSFHRASFAEITNRLHRPHTGGMFPLKHTERKVSYFERARVIESRAISKVAIIAIIIAIIIASPRPIFPKKSILFFDRFLTRPRKHRIVMRAISRIRHPSLNPKRRQD